MWPCRPREPGLGRGPMVLHGVRWLFALAASFFLVGIVILVREGTSQAPRAASLPMDVPADSLTGIDLCDNRYKEINNPISEAIDIYILINKRY